MSSFQLEERRRSLFYLKKGNGFSIRFRTKNKKSTEQDVNFTVPDHTEQEYMHYIKQIKNIQHHSIQYDNSSYHQIQSNNISALSGNRLRLIKKFNMNSAWNSGFQPKYQASVFKNKFLVESLGREGPLHKKIIQQKNKRLNTWMGLNQSPPNRKSLVSSTKNQSKNKFNQTIGNDNSIFKGLVAHQCPIFSQSLIHKRKYGSFLK